MDANSHNMLLPSHINCGKAIAHDHLCGRREHTNRKLQMDQDVGLITSFTFCRSHHSCGKVMLSPQVSIEEQLEGRASGFTLPQGLGHRANRQRLSRSSSGVYPDCYWITLRFLCFSLFSQVKTNTQKQNALIRSVRMQSTRKQKDMKAAKGSYQASGLSQHRTPHIAMNQSAKGHENSDGRRLQG